MQRLPVGQTDLFVQPSMNHHDRTLYLFNSVNVGENIQAGKGSMEERQQLYALDKRTTTSTDERYNDQSHHTNSPAGCQYPHSTHKWAVQNDSSKILFFAP